MGFDGIFMEYSWNTHGICMGPWNDVNDVNVYDSTWLDLRGFKWI